MQLEPRQGKLELVPIEGPEFLKYMGMHARSPETSGSIASQYETQLASADPSVFALALRACDEVAGAISCGQVPLPREAGAVSARIDVVVTHPKLRGLGIASIMMAGVLQRMFEAHGDRLLHASVMAMHPAIAAFVTKCSFVRVEGVKAPLYDVDLTGAHHAQVHRQVSLQFTERFAALKGRCLQCRRHAWASPWCTPIWEPAA